MTRWPALLFTLLTPAATAQPLILGAPAPTPPGETCTSVSAGTARSYACINNAERALVARQRAGLAAQTPNANTPAPQLGLFNEAATRERFAHPAPPNFGAPLPHR